MKKNKGQPHENEQLEQQLTAFGSWLREQGCSSGTVGQYVGVCRKFGQYLDHRDVHWDDVHDGHVDEFLRKLRPRRGSLSKSREYHGTGIRRLLDYLEDTGRCPTPIAPYLDGHATWLRDRGHTEKTISQYASICRVFGRYLRREGIGLSQLSEDDIGPFLEQLRMPRARRLDRSTIRRDYRHRLHLLLAYLRDTGACPRVHPQTPVLPTWVTDYLTFLRDHRGLREATIADQQRNLLRFLAHTSLDGSSEQQLRSLSVRHADEFLVKAARGLKRTSMSGVCATVRGFFGFLHMRGVLDVNLREQVTTPRIYEQERVPRAVPWTAVEKTLALVDRGTAVGRRDYAIMNLLAFYGLRAGDVAMLRLTDLDWRNDVLFVRRAKDGETDALPLLPNIGDALVDYLEIRPSLDWRFRRSSSR